MKPFFVFSGQGAQFPDMGKDFADNSAAAANIFNIADETLGFSLSDIIFNGPEETLTETIYCQTAIYTMSCAALEAFREKFSQIEPVACAGLSLGEYGALYAAGAFDFVSGLKLLAKRAELMDKACKATEGGMASVLNGDPEIIKDICKQNGVDVANYNSPGQIVISGEKAAVATTVDALKAAGLRRVIVLNVAGAFHSRLMKSAGDALQQILENESFTLPSQVPVYHNYTATPAADIVELRRNLALQVAGSVQWESCVRAMAKKGDTMIEFGPGNVLTKLCSRTLPDIKTVNIGTFEQLSGFNM